MKDAEIRFYFDADILGVGKVIATLRSDVTYPGDPGARIGNMRRPPCPIDPGTKDVAWLPPVAGLGWSIITRDARLLRRPGEVSAIKEHRAKVFVIASREGLRVWGQLEVLMQRWRDIESYSARRPGPFAFALTRASIREIPL